MSRSSDGAHARSSSRSGAFHSARPLYTTSGTWATIRPPSAAIQPERRSARGSSATYSSSRSAMCASGLDWNSMWNITPAPAGWPVPGLKGAHQGRSARRVRRSSETYSVGRRSSRSRSRSSTQGSPSRRMRSAAMRGCENSRLLAGSLCSVCLAMGGTVRQRRVGAKRTKAESHVRDRPCRPSKCRTPSRNQPKPRAGGRITRRWRLAAPRRAGRRRSPGCRWRRSRGRSRSGAPGRRAGSGRRR